jgi:hypothetical protein
LGVQSQLMHNIGANEGKERRQRAHDGLPLIDEFDQVRRAPWCLLSVPREDGLCRRLQAFAVYLAGYSARFGRLARREKTEAPTVRKIPVTTITTIATVANRSACRNPNC